MQLLLFAVLRIFIMSNNTSALRLKILIINITLFVCSINSYAQTQQNSPVNYAAKVNTHIGKIYVLYRSEDKSGKGIGERTSRLGMAESTDGITMKRRSTPVFYPANDSQKEFEWPGGCEDPRVAVTEDGTYVMMYTQWNKKVPRLAVATSKDLIKLDKPFFAPTAPFEKSGQYPAGTVFVEGLTYYKNKWFLYCGCADSRVAVAVYNPAINK